MEARVAVGAPGVDEESGLLPRSRPPPASAGRRPPPSSAPRRAPPPPAVWATVDGPLGTPLEDAEGHARRFFLWGFACLPFLWAINFCYFWPVLRSPAASSPAAFAAIRPYVVKSAIGFTIFAAVLLTWATTFIVGGERLFGPVWIDVGDFASVFKPLVDLFKKGIGPDMFSFTIAIRGLCGAGKLQVAKCLIDNKWIGYDVVAFNTLIHGFCNAGDLRGVKQTYENMCSREITPNNFTNATLIVSLCKDQKFVGKLKSLVHLRRGSVPDHVVRLNKRLVAGVTFKKVLNLLDEIRCRGFELDSSIFMPLVSALCSKGDYLDTNINEVSFVLTNLGIR